MKWALPVALLLSGCATDPGGNIGVRQAIVAGELAETKLLPLPGSCVSACTMQLIDPDVCVHPNAEIGFHAATNSLTGEISQDGTALVFSYYARFPKLQARLVRDGAMTRKQVTYYFGRTLIGYGVPQCPFSARASSYRGG